MPTSHCPSCGQELDGSTETARIGDRPKPGDIAVCIYCAAVNQFGDDLMLEPVTGDKLAEVMADPVVEACVAVARRVMAERRK